LFLLSAFFPLLIVFIYFSVPKPVLNATLFLLKKKPSVPRRMGSVTEGYCAHKKKNGVTKLRSRVVF